MKPERRKIRKAVLIAIAICVAVSLILIAWNITSPRYYNTGEYRSTDVLVQPNGTFVARALIADTQQKLEKGLMGSSINGTGGMLLVFQSPSRHGITMRDMVVSIDAVFIGGDKKIAGILRDVPPMSINPVTWQNYYIDSDCQYILELHSGRANALGLSNGITLEFQT
jgi:hypothetical protein